MIDAAAVRDDYRHRFGREPRLFYAPGRVNLIGEHTDYNDGFVLPMAIDRGTLVAAAPRTDRRVLAVSRELDQTVELDLDSPGRAKRGGFVDYVQGIVQVLDRAGALPGVDLVVASDVPLGAGLSSSASLEVSLALAFASLTGGRLDRISLARVCQRAEHEYVGTSCGIMDSFIALFARDDHALLLDCRTLESQDVRLDGGTSILICDTGVKHALATSAYNERRAECARTLTLLREWMPAARSLRDVSTRDFDRLQSALPERLLRRCRHVVTEIDRTQVAARCLQRRDLREFGSLMLASHRSLREDYEVSCPELDFLVDLSAASSGVYGARLTGGGFGGCVISLVATDAADALAATLVGGYRHRFGRTPAIFVSGACGRAEEVFAC